MIGVSAIAGAFKSLIDLGSEYIEDPDKRNEFNMKVMEARNDLSLAVIQSKTTPKVDAIVKLLYAMRDTVLPLLRPVGSAILTGFVAYMRYNGTPLSTELEVMLASAFPGWMLSRHIQKGKEKS